MKDKLAKFIKVETYRGLGQTISCIGESMTKAAKYGMYLDTPDMIAALDFIDFAKLHNFRVSNYNKFDDPTCLREIKFFADGVEKVIRFKLNKGVCRIDLKAIDKAKIKLTDLLEVLYYNPEVNAIFLGLMKEPKQLEFSQCTINSKGKSITKYYYKDIAGHFDEPKLFAETDSKGYILKLGNKGSVLIDRIFECGKYLEIPGYADTKPTTKEERALYEVKLLNNYYCKVEK